MRLVQIVVPDEQRDAIVDVLRDHQLGYTMTDASGDQEGQVVIGFLVPTDAVEHVMNDLEESEFDRETYTVSVKAEFANFDDIDVVQNRWAKTKNKLAPTALRSKAKDLRRNTRSFVWMMVLSAVVAVAGLLMTSPAVVVGSMVIAPIVSPVLTTSVGAVRNDREMFIDSIHLQAIGLGVAILAATVFAWIVKEFHVVPVTLAIEQIELMSVRLSPGILALAVGLAAGAAGAYGLATKGDATIVGVMIAAALIPTAATAGIGFAWGNFGVAIGALILLVLSMISVNIGGTAMLYYLEYRPDDVDAGLLSVESARQAVVVGLTLLLVVATVVAVGVSFYQQSSFERSVNNAVTDVLDDEEYQNLSVTSTTIENTAPSASEETVVTITLARTSNESFPGLPNELHRSITDRTDRTVLVQVQYVDFERSTGSESA